MKYIFFTIFFIFTNYIFSTQESKNAEYRIQAGDVIKITVLDEKDLFRELRVSYDGKINYPLIGQVKVLNKTTHETADILKNLLGEYLVDPEVTVFISEFQKIFIFGEVIRPGAFELSREMSLLESITLAGGLTVKANKKKIKIIRETKNVKKEIIIDLTTITQKGNLDNDINLKPGDIIIIPESFL